MNALLAIAKPGFSHRSQCQRQNHGNEQREEIFDKKRLVRLRHVEYLLKASLRARYYHAIEPKAGSRRLGNPAAASGRLSRVNLSGCAKTNLNHHVRLGGGATCIDARSLLRH